MSVTHTPKPPRQPFSAFVEALAAAVGSARLQPWQKRFLAAIQRRRPPDPTPEQEAAWLEWLKGPPRPRSWRTEAWLRYAEEVRRDWASRSEGAAFYGLDLGREESTGFVAIHLPGGGHAGFSTVDPSPWPSDAPEAVRRFRVDEIARAFAIPAALITNPPYGSPASRLAAIHALSREIEASANAALIESVRKWLTDPACLRARRRVALMTIRLRVEKLDRGAIKGAGRMYLGVLIRAAYHRRQASFGEAWKSAALRYAELQSLHRDLYGDAAEVRP
jgi:hypothetical protein